MMACTHCGGQVVRGQCLQCSREVDPTRITEQDLVGLGLSSSWHHARQSRERHSSPLPLADTRIKYEPWKGRRA